MKKLLFAAVLFMMSAPLFAQTKAERDLESAVRSYNALRDFTGSLKPATITDADVASVSKIAADGLALLDPLIKNEPAKIGDVARYFRANYLYEKAFVLGMKGRRAEAFELMRSIDADMNGFTSSRFPLEYGFEGRNYVVKWENFAPTQGEYNVSMAEFFYEKKDYPNALAYANKANENAAFLSDFLKTLNNYWIIQIKNERKEYDRVGLDAAVNALENFHALEAEERQAGSEDLKTLLDIAPALLDNTLTAHPDLLANGEPYARAAHVLRAEGRGEQYRAFAGKALRAGYRDREFLNQTLNDAAAARDLTLGNLAADRLVGMTAADDCAGMAKLADQYDLLGEHGKASDWRSKSSTCQRRQRNAQMRAQRDFGLYIGGYLFPLFRRDWGAVAGIMTKNVYIEASYQRENDNRDRLLDLQLRGVDHVEDARIYWNGYYAHLAVNGIVKNSRRGLRPYSGVLLGYNLREYESIATDVYDRRTNLYLGQQSFNPVEKRYILMLNSGLHSYGRIFAADIYISGGASYNTFDRGNEAFNSKSNFLYENVLLENRKENRVSFMVRIGITLGFQFGTNTVRQ